MTPAAPSDVPELSIVVARTCGTTAALERCRAALRDQEGAPSRELLVPYDAPCAGSLALQAKFPDVKFLEAKGLDTRAARAGGSREHHDSLRTIGLRAARG